MATCNICGTIKQELKSYLTHIRYHKVDQTGRGYICGIRQCMSKMFTFKAIYQHTLRMHRPFFEKENITALSFGALLNETELNTENTSIQNYRNNTSTDSIHVNTTRAHVIPLQESANQTNNPSRLNNLFILKEKHNLTQVYEYIE